MFQQHSGVSFFRRRRVGSLLILLFAVGASACKESDGAGVGPAPLDLPTRLQSALDFAVSSTATPGGLLAATLPDETLWIGASGVARLSPSSVMRPDQYFKIGSITKSFTAAAILVLAEEGALSLDDKLSTWVPGYFANDDEITIRHLLTHTSGIYNYTDAQEVIPLDAETIEEYMQHLERIWMPEELVAVAASYDPLFPPGADFDYCNTGYILLGIIVGRASGSTWEDVVQSRLLDPIGLDETFTDWLPDVPGELIRGYYWDGTEYVDVTEHHPSWAWSAGSMVATPRDLMRWSQALYGGEILSATSTTELTTPWVVIDEATGISYGFGTVVAETGSGTLLWHTGGMFGYTAYMGAITSRNAHVVAMVNTQGGNVYPVADAAWRLVLGSALHGQ